MRSFTVAVVAAAACQLAQGITLLESRFDASHEGWGAFNGVTGRAWVPTGGRTGGFIQATDGGAEMIWAFTAPDAWLGDRSAAIGGSLSWWLKVDTLAVPMTVPWADLKIGGNGLVLAIDAGPDPGLDWTPYSVRFVPGAWRLGTWDGPPASAADIANVLSDVTFIHVRGEFSGLRDTGSLDDVVLSAVPELPTAALAGAGLVMLAAWRRRRRP